MYCVWGCILRVQEVVSVLISTVTSIVLTCSTVVPTALWYYVVWLFVVVGELMRLIIHSFAGHCGRNSTVHCFCADDRCIVNVLISGLVNLSQNWRKCFERPSDAWKERTWVAHARGVVWLWVSSADLVICEFMALLITLAKEVFGSTPQWMDCELALRVIELWFHLRWCHMWEKDSWMGGGVQMRGKKVHKMIHWEGEEFSKFTKVFNEMAGGPMNFLLTLFWCVACRLLVDRSGSKRAGVEVIATSTCTARELNSSIVVWKDGGGCLRWVPASAGRCGGLWGSMLDSLRTTSRQSFLPIGERVARRKREDDEVHLGLSCKVWVFVSFLCKWENGHGVFCILGVAFSSCNSGWFSSVWQWTFDWGFEKMKPSGLCSAPIFDFSWGAPLIWTSNTELLRLWNCNFQFECLDQNEIMTSSQFHNCTIAQLQNVSLNWHVCPWQDWNFWKLIMCGKQTAKRTSNTFHWKSLLQCDIMKHVHMESQIHVANIVNFKMSNSWLSP